MKTVKTTLVVIAFSLAMLANTACKNNKKDNNSSAVENPDTKKMNTNTTASNFPPIIKNYLALKNALSADDHGRAREVGKMLTSSIEKFDTGSYPNKKIEVRNILANAKENAKHISESSLKKQREHFNNLSKNMENLVSIIGTPTKLYKKYCPMYDDGKGGSWLSPSKAIQNPFYGQKMEKCGVIKKTIES